MQGNPPLREALNGIVDSGKTALRTGFDERSSGFLRIGGVAVQGSSGPETAIQSEERYSLTVECLLDWR